MEIIKEFLMVDIILVFIGGGGLVIGVFIFVKLLNFNIKVIGVEFVGVNCM